MWLQNNEGDLTQLDKNANPVIFFTNVGTKGVHRD